MEGHPAPDTAPESREAKNFIELIIEEDLRHGRHQGRVHTRFPPEPNGYLHIGHAKAICTNFELARQYGGKTNLRFDDTNPSAEEQAYVDGMREDLHWLGYDWEDREYFASDYFDQLYEWALQLVRAGKAYVDDSSPEELRKMRGSTIEPGVESPFRNRSVQENLDLLERMKNGEFAEGSRILRAKIDMGSPNMHLRDPAMYRILRAPHHRTGTSWCIYPMYDWAHGQSDSIEGITHSLCSLEFEVHRPLYDWFIEQLGIYAPRQIEFARLNVSYTITSKRKLRQLVEEGHVSAWDDPRMPTLRGLRRRGYTPASIRNFNERAGLARRNNVIDYALLEFSVREDLNRTSPRVMAVLEPLLLKIENWPVGQVEFLSLENNPEEPAAGHREIPFSGACWIEQSDFNEHPPKKYFRLGPGLMVRLKGAYLVECTGVERDASGRITAVLARYLPESRSGQDSTGLKVKGTIHWVPMQEAVEAEVRLYERLFLDEAPDAHKDQDFLEFLNPESLQVLQRCFLEPSLAAALSGQAFQFLRMGYFCVDLASQSGKLVFNKTVGLKDTWTRQQASGQDSEQTSG